ncbi:MAG: hypothetical protein R3C01_17195 [Planctomycetaceae bacterium]
MKRETKIWLIVFLLGGAWLLYRATSSGASTAYVRTLPFSESPASFNDYTSGLASFSLSRTVGLWVAALLTLAVMSFIYKDNPFYKLAESVLVGVSAAYWMVVGYWTVIIPNLLAKLWPAWVHSWAMPGMAPVRDEYWFLNIVPLVLGVMLLWRLAPQGTWIARWPLAFIIGTTAGLKLVHFLQADFLSQIRAGIQPLIVMDAASNSMKFWDSVSNTIVFVGTLAGLVYFFFSVEHKGVVGKVSRVGIWVLMITFGAAFGYTVMGRIALLAIRFEFLFDDWLWIVDANGSRSTW